ncbi:MAG: hypothetical protein LBF08_07095 [Dysgonamonadaceae bacterium]|jgi:hypothetical protein|nr:hypothetical protein [Dysgonamonadaceae bacterium]
MKYFAHYEEDAVIREDENGECFAKLWTSDSPGHYYLKPEYRISKDGDMRLGNPDYMSLPYEITKEDYDTFGVTWRYKKSVSSSCKLHKQAL